MKHISEVTYNPKPTEPGSSLEYIGLMIELFEAMSDLYGRRWTHPILDTKDKYSRIFQKWCRKLHAAKLTKKDMRRGLDELEKNKTDWPPSYAEFIKLCEKREIETFKPLPPPSLSIEERKKRFKALREKFGI